MSLQSEGVAPAMLQSVLRKAPMQSGTERRRRELFRESPLEVCQRVVLGTAWALRPKRVRNLLPLARLLATDLFTRRGGVPDAAALGEASEFAGIVHDLSVPTLLEAYARGLFPFGHFGRLTWTAPRERAVLLFDRFHISTRLRAIMRQNRYSVTFDRDFEGVITGCAGRRQGRLHLTWITPKIMRAYADLYDAGHVHSFEVWNKEGALAGGGYGVAVGKSFVIESQFFRESNASKIGFSVLAFHLAKWGFRFCDNKWQTPTTAQMGFELMQRARFLDLLRDSEPPVPRGRWHVEAGPALASAWRPDKAVE